MRGQKIDYLGRAKIVLTCREFQIETFEIGRGLWHARAHHTDGRPVSLDRMTFSDLHVGFNGPMGEQRVRVLTAG